jgi:hypothetical protein
MEDLVGIKVVDSIKGECGIVTWGRLFGPVDEDALAKAVRPHLGNFGLCNVELVQVCYSLRDLAHHPYFYEALFQFSREKIPSAKQYKKWLARKRKAVERGREVYFLGLPSQLSTVPGV